VSVEERVAQFKRDYAAIREEIGKVIVGQQPIIDGVVTCLLAGGHALLEGVPGLGKTRLVRTLADVLDLSFSRIQFTPDLMPADILGTNMIVEDGRGKHFEFQPGPIFANMVLADEINRATPKTQSALLEAMQEQTVTVAKRTYPLEKPFFVLATQNPLEMEGTYPLPEAQLDRFLFKLKVEYPSREEMRSIVERTTHTGEPTIRKVADRKKILEMRALALEAEAAPHVIDTAIRVVQATHPDHDESPAITKKYVRFGASPRGAQAIVMAAKILAVMDGRYAVSDQDIERVVKPALRHRMILNFEGEAEGAKQDDILDEVLKSVKKTRRM
jgi:MoxR-like ATPase